MAKWTDNRTAEQKQADRKEKMDHIMKQVTDGTRAVFESERYTQMLKCMSKFHTYSINNIILILSQRPDATLVAGYQAWKTKFHRQVKKGEKGLDILVPASRKVTKEYVEKDEKGRPVLDENGEPVKEKVVSVPYFTTRRVFDISQTEGEPLPTIYNGALTGDVERFEQLKRILVELSPMPVSFEEIEGQAMGYMSRSEQRIVVRSGLSEVQTIKTLIHEIAHAQLHNTEDGEPVKLDQRVRETEAESVAFVVCAALNIDTSDYSFPYLAGWASGKELKELHGSLKRIRQQASENIKFITERMEPLERTQETEIETERITYRIYQVKDEAVELRFMDYGWMEKKGSAISHTNYNCVYTGHISAAGRENAAILDSLFQTFNVNRPKDFTGHSLSVSDVVVLVDAAGTEKPFYVDSFGFKEVPGFLLEQERQNDEQFIFKIGNQYLLLDQSEGWDYNILDSDFQMEEGGHLELLDLDGAVSAICNRYDLIEAHRVLISESDFAQLQQIYTQQPSVTLYLFKEGQQTETRTLTFEDAEQLFQTDRSESYDSAQLQLTYVKDGMLHRYESADRLYFGETNLREQLLEDGAVKQWLDRELLPFLKAHDDLTRIERDAQEKIQSLMQLNEQRDLTANEIGMWEYNSSLQEYVADARTCLNTGAGPMPEQPRLQEFVEQTQQPKEKNPADPSVNRPGSLSDKLRQAAGMAEERNQRQSAPGEAHQQPDRNQKVL